MAFGIRHSNIYERADDVIRISLTLAKSPPHNGVCGVDPREEGLGAMVLLGALRGHGHFRGHSHWIVVFLAL